MRITPATLLLPGALALAACNMERSEPAARDLTLLSQTESATAAVVSARELDLPKSQAAADARAALAARPAPARTRAHPAELTADAAVVAPTPAPEADALAAGAGTSLEPGQTVTVIPATSGAGAGKVPGSEVLSDRDVRRPWIIIGDDRCVPGRGEVIPRGPRGLRGGFR